MPLRAVSSEDGLGTQVLARIFTWWPAKMFGTMAAMAAFFVVYFLLLRHPVFTVHTMPLTVVDRWVGFHPEALPLYVSLWFYISLAPALLSDRRELLSYVAAAVALCVIGFAVFFFWPTTVPAFALDWPEHSAFGLLRRADAAGNASPSLHAAYAVFSGFWFDRVWRELRAGATFRVLNVLWCAGILYSTLATRQHVFLDLLAGSILGAAVALANFRWLRETSPVPVLIR